MTHVPILILPKFGERFEVICDASMVGKGAVLLQDGKPIAFESRKLTPAERNYTTCEQELTAIVHAMQTWRCYLKGSDCVVVTDHNPLTYLKSQQNLSRHQARWLEYLEQTFVYSWKYHPRTNNVANPLSKNLLDQRTVRLALLTISASNMIQRLVRARTISGDSTIEKTRGRRSFHGYDNDLLSKTIVGYALDP